MNSRPAARGSQEAGFTQPRDHSFDHTCSVTYAMQARWDGRRDLESAFERESERGREGRGWPTDTPNEKHACPLPLSYKFHSWDDNHPEDLFSYVDLLVVNFEPAQRADKSFIREGANNERNSSLEQQGEWGASSANSKLV